MGKSWVNGVLWVYKPIYSPIGKVGLLDIAKPRHQVNGVMTGIKTKFQPNRPCGHRDTTQFSKWAGQGAGGYGQTPPLGLMGYGRYINQVSTQSAKWP